LINITSGAISDTAFELAQFSDTLVIKQVSISRELELARNVQASMLPANHLGHGHGEFSYWYIPSREVGGDYVDFFPISDHEVGVAIADVSGKGFPAALMLPVLKSAIRGIAHQDFNLKFQLIEEQFSHVLPESSFITLLFGILNTDTLTFSFINAGHQQPIIFRKSTGQVVPFDPSENPPIGVFQAHEWRTQNFSLEIGDILFLYTDGLCDSLKSECSLKDVTDFLRTLTQKDPSCWNPLLEELSRNSPHPDDLTLLIARIV